MDIGFILFKSQGIRFTMQCFRGPPRGGRDPIVSLLNSMLCNGSWPGQMGSRDRAEITLGEAFAQQMNDLAA